MGKTSEITVHKTTCTTPGSQWKVEGLRGDDGKRRRKFFATRGQAEHFAAVARLRRQNEGLSGQALSDNDRNEAALCLARLRGRGKSLLDATRHYLAYLDREERAITVEKLIEEFIPAKRQDGVSTVYLKTLKSTVDRFAEEHGAQAVGEILPHEIDDWLRSLKVGASSRNSYRAMIAAFFSYATARGYAQSNPMDKVSKAKAAPSKIHTLTPEQTQRLLDAACAEVVPHLAIAAFAGLRDAEIKRLDWAQIHPDRKHPVIEVKAENAKLDHAAQFRFSPTLRDG
jgi:integrase